MTKHQAFNLFLRISSSTYRKTLEELTMMDILSQYDSWEDILTDDHEEVFEDMRRWLK